MERDEALGVLREVAVEVLSVEPDTVTEGARFKEDLDADSLDLVELVMGLEERFDISVPEEDLEGVTTVGQAVDLVLAKVGAESMSRPCALDHGRPRVVVTGIGVKTPAGTDVADVLGAAAARASRPRGPIQRFDPAGLAVTFAGEVRDFDPVAVLRAQGGAPPGPCHPARLRRRRRRARETPASSAPTRAAAR